MPRGGWKKARDFFCEKFSCEVSEEEFKRQAHTIKIDPLESDYSQTKKKIKSLNSLSPTSAIEAASVHHESKTLFHKRIKINASITEFQRTWKVPKKFHKELLFSLNKIAGEYMVTNLPKTMCEVARILQTVQWCYHKTSLKPKLLSNPKQSIENKISAFNNLIELLKKAKYISKVSGIKIKAAKQVMKRLNPTLKKPHDAIEAIISLKESARIYEKKIEMHTKRKER
ncbi:hypothetical protein TCON_1664 [Astathelohania contejeani]|uniref:Uncharacterized protein n=1 Tax=Astathelohania contejeani TaxID=164912 RepID=A0ABQ7HY47_9MICR|nr:hypothetical protein TCON_1664 [Thelohania contejeani]